MRMTFKFTTAGDSGLASIPTIAGDGSDYADSEGVLIESKARASLRNTPGIQFSDNDNGVTIAFTVELLSRIKRAFSALAGVEVGYRRPGETANEPKTTCDRRMERGKVTFVRIDVRTVQGGIKVRVSVNNPRSVVGNAEEMARLSAQAFIDNIVAIKEDIQDQGSAVIIEEGEGCGGMVSEAVRRNTLALKRAELNDCERRRNGYCSPCKFDCFFYKNGKCSYDD